MALRNSSLLDKVNEAFSNYEELMQRKLEAVSTHCAELTYYSEQVKVTIDCRLKSFVDEIQSLEEEIDVERQMWNQLDSGKNGRAQRIGIIICDDLRRQEISVLDQMHKLKVTLDERHDTFKYQVNDFTQFFTTTKNELAEVSETLRKCDPGLVGTEKIRIETSIDCIDNAVTEELRTVQKDREDLSIALETRFQAVQENAKSRIADSKTSTRKIRERLLTTLKQASRRLGLISYTDF